MGLNKTTVPSFSFPFFFKSFISVILSPFNDI
jgi:hypothetical protein